MKERDIDAEILGKLIAEGLTRNQMAERLECHYSAVDRRLRFLGLSTGRTGPRAGSRHPEWKGGRNLDKHGYVLVWVPLHPNARRPAGVVAEHRLLAEVLLGRYLTPTEVIDHIDGHPRQNHGDNLRMFPSNADHLAWTTSCREKTTPRESIPGAYKSPQKLSRCPDENETLAQCPSEIRYWLSWYIESHRPTIAHQNFSRQSLLRSGAWRNPFRTGSRG